MKTSITLNKSQIDIIAKNDAEMLLNVKNVIIDDIQRKIENLQNEYDRVCKQPTINDLKYLGYAITHSDHDEMIERLRNIESTISPFKQNY